MSLDAGELRRAIVALHRGKDAAYRDAWKKRGELISIIANIARKVDRLEYVVAGAPTTEDETRVDTAIDLLVYCLKYETFLADLDNDVASTIFGGDVSLRPYSDGCLGFEHALSRVILDAVEFKNMSVAEACGVVVRRFNQLTACFDDLQASSGPLERFDCVDTLITSTAVLLATLQRDHRAAYDDFVELHSSRVDR